jgi:hypothetical protein
LPDISSFKDNLQAFVVTMQGAVIEKVVYKEDKLPTFDKDNLPFQFKYCYSITLGTDKGSFLVHSTMTSSGIETFWIDLTDRSEIEGSVRSLNSKVEDIIAKDGYGGEAYKLSIKHGNGILIVFAAEIYVQADGGYNIKPNDEMILVFEDKEEAVRFEARIGFL